MMNEIQSLLLSNLQSLLLSKFSKQDECEKIVNRAVWRSERTLGQEIGDSKMPASTFVF